jgi:O-antigen biosynthesis protein WbqV
VEVLGSVDKLSDMVARLHRRNIRPQMVVLANDDAVWDEVEHLLDLTSGTELKVGRLPKLGTLSSETTIRPVVLSDLLGRPEIAIDAPAVASMIRGKRVLITGAGGSIGSELSRQVAALAPALLVIADASEFNLYSINQEIEERWPQLNKESALLDVRDGALVTNWLRHARPDIVFHAAALKHVPLLEEHPIEAVKTNVFGTVNMAEACRASGVSAMVTISTDKAVNPHNVMGATKRLAEAYCQGLDQATENSGVLSSTRFVTVRFGNVLGSAGSVVPLFQRQIEAGGPVTVTHENITRYFMTIPEAVTLVLQAGAQGIGRDNERGSIYVLDMGKPVRIIELARQMIRLSGRRPDVDVKIKIIGLRPGEKLYEEVTHTDEAVAETSSRSVFKATPRFTDLRIVQQQLQELRAACNGSDRERMLRVLNVAVPEYSRSAPVPAPQAAL